MMAPAVSATGLSDEKNNRGSDSGLSLNAVSETDGIDMTFNDDESVMLRWEACAEEDRPVEVDERVEEAAPF